MKTVLKNKCSFAAILFLLFFTLSCKKKNIEFDFQITNNTSYNLDSVEFSFVEENFESLAANATTDIITLTCTGREVVSPIFLDVQIISYSNTDSVFTNTRGSGVSMSRENLSTSEVNSIIISIDPAPQDEDYFFKIELEN